MAGIEVTGKYKNKVIYGTTVLVDLTADTVTKDTLKKGATAHDASGEPITGTLTIPDQQARTVDLNMPSGNQTIIPDNGKVLSKVTVTKPTTMIPENIKKDVNIGGVIGTLESGGTGGSSETWVLNDIVEGTNQLFEEGVVVFNATFTSNGTTFTALAMVGDDDMGYSLEYSESEYVSSIEVAVGNRYDFMAFSSGNYIYRKITFSTPPTGDLLTWLEANAVKQASDTAVQESKSISITENGTTTVSPDVPYDAIKSVEVVTNAASSGGGKTIWYDPV